MEEEKMKLLNFNTDSFEFKVYTGTTLEDNMIKEFNDDELTSIYLKDFYSYIMETVNDLKNEFVPLRFTNIIYNGGIPVGIVSLFDNGNELVISHGISPSKRGHRYSSMMKKEIYDYIFRNLLSVERIVAYVEESNTNNLSSIKKNPLSDVEKVYDSKENKNYLKFIYYNPYLEKKKTI